MAKQRKDVKVLKISLPNRDPIAEILPAQIQGDPLPISLVINYREPIKTLFEGFPLVFYHHPKSKRASSFIERMKIFIVAVPVILCGSALGMLMPKSRFARRPVVRSAQSALKHPPPLVTKKERTPAELEREWCANANIEATDMGQLASIYATAMFPFSEEETARQRGMMAFGSIPTTWKDIDGVERRHLGVFFEAFEKEKDSWNEKEVVCLAKIGLNSLTPEKVPALRWLFKKLLTFKAENSSDAPPQSLPEIIIRTSSTEYLINDHLEVSRLGAALEGTRYSQEDLLGATIWALTDRSVTNRKGPLFAHAFLLMNRMRLGTFYQLFNHLVSQKPVDEDLLLKVLAAAMLLPKVPLRAVEEAFGKIQSVPRPLEALCNCVDGLLKDTRASCEELVEEVSPESAAKTPEETMDLAEVVEVRKEEAQSEADMEPKEEELPIVAEFSEELQEMSNDGSFNTAEAKTINQFTSKITSLYLYAIKMKNLELLHRLLDEDVSLAPGEVRVCFDVIMKGIQADDLPILSVLLTHPIFQPKATRSAGATLYVAVVNNNLQKVQSLLGTGPDQDQIWRAAKEAFGHEYWVILRCLMNAMTADRLVPFIQSLGTTDERVKATAVALCLDQPRIQNFATRLGKEERNLFKVDEAYLKD